MKRDRDKNYFGKKSWMSDVRCQMSDVDSSDIEDGKEMKVKVSR
jgi:hypothetical protein